MSKLKSKDAYLKQMTQRGRTKTPMQHYDGGFWGSMSGFTSFKKRNGDGD